MKDFTVDIEVNVCGSYMIVSVDVIAETEDEARVLAESLAENEVTFQSINCYES